MTCRPHATVIALAVAAALAPAAHAEDLLQSYQLARSSDPQFAAAESTRLLAREGVVQARSALLPQIDGSAGLTRSRSSGPATSTQYDPSTNQFIRVSGDTENDTLNKRLGINLAQALFDPGARSQVRAQQALDRASDFQLQAAGNGLITRTSQAYFNVLVALETLSAAQAQEAALKKQFDFADKRLEVGLAPITDVHEARAQYDAARANTISVRNALEDAWQALAEITGKPVVELKALPKDFQPNLPEARDADAWVAAATSNNPALQAKQAQVESAEIDIATARAAFLPRLGLSGSYGYNATSGDSTFSSSAPPISATNPIDNSSRGPSIGLNLTIPIWNGGLTASRVRSAIARRDIAQDELEQQRRALARSTRNAYQSLVAGISEVEARRLALVAAQSAYEASQVGLEVGTRTVLDVLNNQRNLFEAQRLYALARYSFLQNRLLLEQAAGSLDIDDVQDVNRFLTQSVTVPVAVK